MSNENKQVAILGLGIFGSTLAETLSDYGIEVLAIDKDPICVERMADIVTRAVVADVTNKEELIELGVDEFDTVVVSISKHFEESVLCTMILKELGVKNVIAKARTKRKSMILTKVGANKIVNVEKDMAHRVAKQLLRRSIVDLVEIDEQYSIVEITVPMSWVNKTVMDLNIRQKYGMNIIGIRNKMEDKMNMNFSADYVIQEGDHFVVVAQTEEIEKWDYLTKQ